MTALNVDAIRVLASFESVLKCATRGCADVDPTIADSVAAAGATLVAEIDAAQFPSFCLFVACRYGHLRLLALLLDGGQCVSHRWGGDFEGETPLFIVCQAGHKACARLLLDRGAAVDAAAHDGCTPLIVASMRCHHDCIALLLEHGASPNSCRWYDKATALHFAMVHDNIASTRLLLDRGAYQYWPRDLQGRPMPTLMEFPSWRVRRCVKLCIAVFARRRWRAVCTWVRVVRWLQRLAARRAYAPGGPGFEECKRRRVDAGMRP